MAYNLPLRLGSILTTDCYYTRAIKSRIPKAKEAFNWKISLDMHAKYFTQTLVRCYNWRIMLNGSETKKIKAEFFWRTSKFGAGEEL